MEIIIGSIPPLPPQTPKGQERPAGMVEAQLLHVRPPRKGISGPAGMERRGKSVSDPRQARILTVMVPDATTLPTDLDQGKYSVYMRFVRK